MKGLSLLLFLLSSSASGASPVTLEGAERAMPDRSAALADYRARLFENIADLRFPDGVSERARATVPRVVRKMSEGMPLDLLAKVVECRAGVLVVPDGMKPTDFAPFKDFDGRRAFQLQIHWGKKKVGGIQDNLLDGSAWVAIKDETFRGGKDWPLPETALAHEWAHLVQTCALRGPASEEVKALYRERDTSSAVFPTGYATVDPWEYFAESVAVWFSVRATGRGRDGNRTDGAGWIRRNDPKMAELLEQTFGPPRDLTQ